MGVHDVTESVHRLFTKLISFLLFILHTCKSTLSDTVMYKLGENSTHDRLVKNASTQAKSVRASWIPVIDGTRSQRCTDMQSLVKCLDPLRYRVTYRASCIQ